MRVKRAHTFFLFLCWLHNGIVLLWVRPLDSHRVGFFMRQMRDSLWSSLEKQLEFSDQEDICEKLLTEKKKPRKINNSRFCLFPVKV